jgi:hypothetical protein
MDNIEGQIMREIEEAEEEDDEDTRLRQVAAVGLLVYAGAEESRRLRAERRYAHRTYLTRPELQPNPREESAWQRLYRSQNDRAFITTMGLNVAAFDQILSAGFEESWNSTAIPRNDVTRTAAPRLYRRSLDAAGALGLILHFLSSTMPEVSLQQIFALIPTTTSRYINFSFGILLAALRKIQEASILWPEGDEFEELADLVIARHHLLTGAFGTMDGLNLAIQVSRDQEIENATYNGWLHEHFVSSVLAFGSNGM